MAVVVQKYGGSSVADVGKLGAVADKVVATKQAGHDVVVVVSAMGRTTDELLSLARQVDDSPPRRELDMLLSSGERMAMALLSMAIQKRGCDAISFTGSQSGIITNDRHYDARIIEVRPHRVEDELARGRVVILAGYQGMSYKREITTLGRGGSDTTALAMAAALGAERAEIYSDVDGVYSADPNQVDTARHLPELTYEEMQEMSQAGAKVLHADAIEFARRRGIALHARSTFGGSRETVIHGGATEAPTRAVTGRQGVARVAISAPGRLREALQAAEERGLVPMDTESSEEGTSFLIVTDQAPDWPRARASLLGALGDASRVTDGLGTATVVGRAFGRDPGALIEALEALHDARIEPLRVHCGPLRLCALMTDSAVDAAVVALHDAFIT